MKKFKQFFSLMLVGVLVLTGSVLMACGKEKDKTPPAGFTPDKETVTTILTNLKTSYESLSTGEGEIPVVERNESIDLFDCLLEEEQAHIQSGYNMELSEFYASSVVEPLKYIDVALAVLEIEDFGFNKNYDASINRTADFIDAGEVYESRYLTLTCDEEKIRLEFIHADPVQPWEDVDFNYEIIISDIYYQGTTPVYQEFYSTYSMHAGHGDSINKIKLLMPTQEDVKLDGCLNVQVKRPREGMENEYLYICSEPTNESVYLRWDDPNASDAVSPEMNDRLFNEMVEYAGLDNLGKRLEEITTNNENLVILTPAEIEALDEVL